MIDETYFRSIVTIHQRFKTINQRAVEIQSPCKGEQCNSRRAVTRQIDTNKEKYSFW